MRILFLTDNFPPEVNAPANRTFEHCREWVRLGASVTIITCFPNFPTGKVFEEFRNKLFKVESMDGIRVIRVWTYVTSNSGVIRRTLDYISYGIASFMVGLWVKSDIIIGTSPQFFTAISAWMLSFFKRRPWIMEVRDLWPESIVAVGAIRNNLIIRFLERLEMAMYQHARKVIVVTDSFKSEISARGIPATKISVFKNGVDLTNYQPGPPDQALKASLGLDGKMVLAYIGTLGMAHGLSFILDCAQDLQDNYPDVIFLFIGDGASKNELMEKAQLQQIKNVLFVPSVPKKEVIRYLNLTDIALVNLKRSNTFLSVIPSKIFEIAAVQKPILLGLAGETRDLVKEYESGVWFTPEDKSDFKNAFLQLYNSRGDWAKYKAGCRRMAEDFDRSHIAARMLEEIRYLVH